MSEQNVTKDQPIPAMDRVTDQLPAQPEVSTVAFSNAVRLTGREWIIVGIFSLLLILFAPSLWKQYEECTIEPDFRMPYELGNDYWLYERFAALASEKYDTVLIGDSVVWGEYVTRQETLSHYLNKQEGRERYVNLGLNGSYPLALTGLVEHYAGSIRGKNVVLQCNPLWLTSREQDLQIDKKPEQVNHLRLIPQFVPRIPRNNEDISTRIGVVVEQHVPMSSWANHLQQTYYDQSDIPSWTLEHPYDNPVKPLTKGLPPLDNGRRHLSQSWVESKIDLQDYEWIDLTTSLQWAAFRSVVRTLQQRENQVFVLVGPFNEHMLQPDSLKRYQKVKATIAAWLEQEQIPHLVPMPLQSKYYGDASHPLAEGYAELARQLLERPFFRSENRPR